MKNLEMTDRRELENLLAEIYRNCQNHQVNPRKEFQDVIHQFNGKIGDQINFDGNFYDKGDEENSYVKIKLYNQQQNLATIETEHGFINPGSMPFWTDVWAFELLGSNQPKPIADTTEIKVITPRWNVENGVSEAVYDENKKKRLAVYHAPDEIAKNVVMKLCNSVSYSKDHSVIKEKLKHLNLPSNIKIKNLDAIVDSVTSQIHNVEQEDITMEK